MKNPCTKDCPDRTPDCHCDCERYIRFAKNRREYLDHKRQQNVLNDYYYDRCAERNKKWRRKKK